VFSILFIILFSPILILAVFLVKITSRGPVIFLNERIGEDGKIFNLFKFRTMYAKHSIGKQFAGSAEALAFEQNLIRERGIKAGPVYKIKNDPRLTPVGKFLRRTSIDELPQFFNVLLGNMSLVGPRPHQLREVEKYERRHLKVLDIKPGITGIAQVSGRADLDFEDEVRLDTYYVENWSLALDLYILLKTPIAVLKGKGTY
jgi:lipopolysaccharide/colanic/teichoic acid biosynthesis glycosyltransferase